VYSNSFTVACVALLIVAPNKSVGKLCKTLSTSASETTAVSSFFAVAVDEPYPKAEKSGSSEAESDGAEEYSTEPPVPILVAAPCRLLLLFFVVIHLLLDCS
jgi:hypothetical protein